MKVVAYTRVSTQKQVADGDGLGVQLEAVQHWAMIFGHDITEVFTDEGESGGEGIETRVALGAALAACKHRDMKGLVVPRLDRLARDLIVQEQLLREFWLAKVDVFSTSAGESVYLKPDDPADPSRKMIRQILGAVSEYERNMIRLRLMNGRRRKKARGGWSEGPPPYGYRLVNAKLVRVPREQKVIERIIELRGQEFETPFYGLYYEKSARTIATVLNEEGVPSPGGGKWHPEAVRRILERVGKARVKPAEVSA